MTYEESYRKCSTYEELKEEVRKDAIVATLIGNPDRISMIEKVATKVANEKGWFE